MGIYFVRNVRRKNKMATKPVEFNENKMDDKYFHDVILLGKEGYSQ